MDLSQLKFAVDTTELEKASTTLGTLVQNLGKLDKASRDAARTEATLAKAAKDNASANLDNAKAQAVNAKAVESTEKAQKSAAASIEKSNSILQRQNDIYDFQTQGFSKGQSGILASAKATGQLSEELKKVLIDQKAFESNPFDKSELGLQRLQKTMKEVVAAQGFFNEGSSLTTKQARELSNDLDRIGVSLTKQGKSYQEVTKAQALHKQEFIQEAAAVNRAQNALDIVTKQRKEVVTATNYLTQADQKLAAALNTTNTSLDRAGTDSLVKYESALRKSGLSQDVVTSKLATYKTQLAQVQAQEMKRSEQHLARAAAPQLTDIGVSLYSGQAPMTVLLQQSGQLVDLLNLSGVEASKFGDILRTSFYSMVPAIKQVAIGIAGLVGGLFMDAGRATASFIGNITGISAVMDVAKRAIVSGGEENFKYIASLEKISKSASMVAATGIAALIVAVITLGLEYKKIIQSEGDLSKALATSGGAIGFSKDQAVAYAEGMKSIGVGTLQAMGAITEFTKVGKIGKDGLDMIIKSAIDLEKNAGIPISETAKKFAELQDAPTKALTNFAETNGYVSKSVLDTVASLEQQGDKTAAATAATEAMRLANVAMSDEIKSNLSPIEELWNSIKTAIGRVKQEIYDLTTSNAAISVMKTVWETVAVVVSEVWFTLKGVGKEIGGVAAQIASVMRGDFAGAKTIGEQMKIDAASARAEQDKLIESILNRGNQEKKNFSDSKAQNSQYAKWRKENEQSLDKSISKEDKYKAKQIETQKAVLAGTISQVEADKALAGWKSIIMGDKKGPSKLDPGEIAKHQLDADISNIRKTSEAQVKAYSDGESILEALRSAGLVDESDYYTSKKIFLELSNQAGEDALQKEIDRLKQEKLIGTDKIDNDKKIAEAKAKLGLAQEKSTHSMLLLSLQEEAAGRKLAQYYRDAEDAAQSYLDTLRRSQSRELAGAGVGTSERSRQSGRNQIEDKYSQQFRDLEKSRRDAEANGIFGSDAEAKYNNELERIKRFKATSLSEYDAYYAERLKQEADWSKGASESIANYLSEIENVAKASENMFTNAFKNMEDALVNFVKTGKLDFASLADSIINDMIRIAIQQTITKPLAQMGGDILTLMFKGFANGGSFDNGVKAFANGDTFTNSIVSSPTLFKFAGGTGVMGEAGPEAIMPLSRGANGKLGVQLSGYENSKNSSGAITIVNNTSAKIGKVTEQRMSDGERVLIIEEATQAAEARINAAMQDPNSKTSRSMSRNFSLQRSR